MGYDRRFVVGMAAAAVAVATVGFATVAAAVSGGGYDPGQQDCPANANANNAGAHGAQQTQNPVPGCHNFEINVTDSRGNRYAEVGLDQLPAGYASTPGLASVGYPQSPNFPHSGCAALNTAGTGGGTGTGCGNNGAGAGGSVTFNTESLLSCTYPTDANGTPTGPPTCGPGSGDAVTVRPDTGTNVTPLLSIVLGADGGINFYMGADDNLDAGEHDGASGNNGTKRAINGPSDGGAITAHVTPSRASTAPTAANPVPVAGASEGQCADGFCTEITTYQQQMYSGGTSGSRDVANYDGKNWDPYSCSSGDTSSESPASCGGTSMNDWRRQEKQQVNAEPGVQVYEDPDPQASPIDPVYEAGITPQPNLYPIPAAYVGTCGVVAGGGPVASAPAGTPSTNGAGQVVVSPTGC